MRVGIGVSEDLPVAEQQALARHVEDRGFSSLWTNEARGRDALLVCQAWAAVTTDLLVGTGVVPVWTRSPAQLAMAAATLQEASGGRFLLGLGVSHPATMDPWHGAAYRRPLDAARDAVTIVQQLVAGGGSDHEGAVFSSRDFALGIAPPPPPARVYLAAMGPVMLTVAGEHADGVLLNWSTAEETGRAASRVRAAAARVGDGRTPSSVDVAAYVRVAVHDDGDAARDALARQVSRYIALPAYADHLTRQGFREGVEAVRAAYRSGGPDAAAEAVPEAMLRGLGWYGTPSESPGALARYSKAGLDLLVARVVVVGDDPAASVRAVADALARVGLTG